MKEHKLLFIAIYAISSLICTSCNNETLVDQETANKNMNATTNPWEKIYLTERRQQPYISIT